MSAFETWWHDEGSGMPPIPGEDAECHVKRVSQVAWSNGDFKARAEFFRVANECGCRADHGAEGGEHLKFIEGMIKKAIHSNEGK